MNGILLTGIKTAWDEPRGADPESSGEGAGGREGLEDRVARWGLWAGPGVDFFNMSFLQHLVLAPVLRTL